MINVYPANSRHVSDHGWLTSRFSFSFADYYDPNNTQFGVMRVLNDDTVQAGRGFGAHPHKEMEIVSIVLSGYLQHQDSTGRTATTTFGGIQRMSAGTGIIHSEMNASDREPVEFLQLWFHPETSGLAPSYEQTEFDQAAMKNTLLPVVAKNPGRDDVAHIHQDLTIYLSKLDPGKALRFEQREGRKQLIFVLEGELKLNGETSLGKRDSARIEGMSKIEFEAGLEQAFFMFIDLP